LFKCPQEVALREHKDFAADLMDRGLFCLPYPTTAISFAAGPLAWLVVLHQLPKGISAILCADLSGGCNPIPIFVSPVNRLYTNGVGEMEGLLFPEKRILLRDDYLSAARHRELGSLSNVLTLVAARAIVMAFGYIVAFMSKGVVVNEVVPSEKLNRRREQRGKPPLRAHYVISFDLGSYRTLHCADGSTTDIDGHTRGAPRPHWRRGHFRTLYRGTSNERVIPVAPALVGANENADPIRAKVYSARKRRS
jgi:hypothetical protein